MAQALNQAYEWSVNPMTGLLPDGSNPFGSMFPSASLDLAPNPGPIPYAAYPPTPNSSPAPFDWEQEQARLMNSEQYPLSIQAASTGVIPVHSPVATPVGEVPGTPNIPTQTPLPTPNLIDQNKPYYDARYPEESMIALKNWLNPQIAAGVQAAQNPRGMLYSGTGAYSTEGVENYADQYMPSLTAPEAQAQDLANIYGTPIVNDLIRQGDIPGATAFAPNLRSGGFSTLGNPLNPPNSGAPTPQDNIGVLLNPNDFAQYNQNNPNGSPTQFLAGDYSQPSWGLDDQTAGQLYSSPGYFYNPNVPPPNFPKSQPGQPTDFYVNAGSRNGGPNKRFVPVGV